MDGTGTAATHLGCATDIEIIGRLVELEGRTIADVGCGDGRVARALADLGATVVGVEPDPIQAAKNREADAHPGVTLIEGAAERLPQDTASVDGVIFSKSLHHVPREGMDAGLREAARVLKPGNSFSLRRRARHAGRFFPARQTVPRRNPGPRMGGSMP